MSSSASTGSSSPRSSLVRFDLPSSEDTNGGSSTFTLISASAIEGDVKVKVAGKNDGWPVPRALLTKESTYFANVLSQNQDAEEITVKHATYDQVKSILHTLVSRQTEELQKMTMSKLIALHKVAKRWRMESVAETIAQVIYDYELDKDKIDVAIRLWKFINHSKQKWVDEKLKRYLAENANQIFRQKADVVINMPIAMAQYLFSCERGVTLRESQILKLAQSWYDNYPSKTPNYGPNGLKIFYSLLPLPHVESLAQTPRYALNPHLNDAKWFKSQFEKAKERRDPSKVLANYGASPTGEFIVPVERVELLGETVYTSPKLVLANLAWTLEIRTVVGDYDVQTFVVDLRCHEALYSRSVDCEAVVVLTMVNHVDEKKSVILREKKRFTDEDEETRRLTEPLQEVIPRNHLRKEAAESQGWCIKDSFEFKVFLCINA